MGNTITIGTKNERQSSYLYGIVNGYLSELSEDETKGIKYMSVVPSDHPYTPKTVSHGLSITFSELPESLFSFLMNVGRLVVVQCKTNLYYDDEVVSDLVESWPSENYKKTQFIRRTISKRDEMRYRNYFNVLKKFLYNINLSI